VKRAHQNLAFVEAAELCLVVIGEGAVLTCIVEFLFLSLSLSVPTPSGSIASTTGALVPVKSECPGSLSAAPAFKFPLGSNCQES
jgi:hypothetical protein